MSFALSRISQWLEDWKAVLPTLPRSELKILCAHLDGFAQLAGEVRDQAFAVYRKGGEP